MSYRSLQKITRAPGFFWAPPDQIQGDSVVLTGDEAHHAASVCRLAAGEMITVCDGQGNAYDCEISASTSREITATVVRVHRRLGEPAAQITLAVGVGKPAAFDWMVEKAVELGAVRIIPIRAAESPAGVASPEASGRRVERWRRLALGAMKQSLRSVWPAVEEVTTLEDALARTRDYQHLWLADPEGQRLPASPARVNQSASALLFVGPESGFVESECAMLREAGVNPISLGNRRLRAETAAVTALALIMHHLGEL
jgi:16S rRNA (uracil1498-N3)-methyltransferase